MLSTATSQFSIILSFSPQQKETDSNPLTSDYRISKLAALSSAPLPPAKSMRSLARGDECTRRIRLTDNYLFLFASVFLVGAKF